MAEVKWIRAQDNNLPPYQDGQVIATPSGDLYIDFPAEQRQLMSQLHKHDTEAGWLANASNYIPALGEIVLIDPDGLYNSTRLKLGDGITPFATLPYLESGPSAAIVNQLRFYNPDLLCAEYSNSASGYWKSSIKNINTSSEISGSSIFLQHQDSNYQEKIVTFNSGNAKECTCQTYSVTNTPGVIDIDTIELKLKENSIKFDEENYISKNSFFMENNAHWSTQYVEFVNNTAKINGPANKYHEYMSQTFTLKANVQYTVVLDIAAFTSGGVNYYLKSTSDNSILLKGYQNKATRLIKTYTPTTDVEVKFYIGGSGTSTGDVLTVRELSVSVVDQWLWAEHQDESSILDNTWTNYSATQVDSWGQTVEIDQSKCLAFVTGSASDQARKRKQLTLLQDYPYRISFKIQVHSCGVNMYIRDSANATIKKNSYSQPGTFATSNALTDGWTLYSFDFYPPKSDTYTFSIETWSNATAATVVYIKELSIERLGYQNLIVNYNFTEDARKSSVNKVGQGCWSFNAYSSVVDGAARLSATAEYQSGCKQDICLRPNCEYEYKIKYRSVALDAPWKPYTTFTKEDLISFVTEPIGQEALHFGGPWANSNSLTHGARFTIQGEANKIIELEELSFNALINTSNNFTVMIDVEKNGILEQLISHVLTPTYSLASAKIETYRVPFKTVLDDNTVIHISFGLNAIDASGLNKVFNIAANGKTLWNNTMDLQNYADYRIDANKNIHLHEALYAKHINGIFDDGCLTWEELTR